MNETRVLVLEGPAGSGKSFIGKRLEELKLGTYVKPPFDFHLDRPRGYEEGATGILRSEMKDFMALLSIIAAGRLDFGKFLIVDRFMVSQWVYGSIRAKMPPRELEMMKLLGSTFDMIETSLANYHARSIGVDSRPTEVFKFLFLFCLPSIDVISSYRLQTDKKYPFPIDVELSNYMRAYESLNSALNYFGSTMFRPHSFATHAYSYRTPGATEKLISDFLMRKICW